MKLSIFKRAADTLFERLLAQRNHKNDLPMFLSLYKFRSKHGKDAINVVQQHRQMVETCILLTDKEEIIYNVHIIS